MRSSVPVDELICAHWTFSGAHRRVPFEERVRAAAGAGVRHIGWALDDFAAARSAGMSGRELRRLADNAGVRVAEIEFLRGWAGTEGTKDVPGMDVGSLPWTAQERILLEMAEVFEADHVNVGDDGSGNAMLAWSELVDRFGAICARAAQSNLLVVLEFMPWTGFPDLESAWRLIREVDAPNGAILLDTWHFFRGSGNMEYLEVLPEDALGLIQVNDAGPPQGEMIEDTMLRRVFPGDGEFDLEGMFSKLVARNLRAPVSVEVMSNVIEVMSPADAVKRAKDSASQLLGRVGW
jgi:sugar phosphate isomerase/epimerase